MTQDDITLVRKSWAQVVPIADTAMRMFYETLFDADDRVARLFAGTDMTVQRRHLAEAIDLVVARIEDPTTLAPVLQDLGARHAGYGVSEGDFATVGQALLSTLERGLGDNWTDAHARAWGAAWAAVAVQVQTGYQRAQAA